jgi:hypothetical protein
LGFEELSPNKTADELFGNLKAGDKVALTSRFADNAKAYMNALNRRGIVARVIAGQSGTQDFCFLMSARKEMAGMLMSTYAIWASLLGNATRARLYTVKSQSRVKRFGDNWFVSHNFTNPELRHKIVYEGYLDEEMEKLEKQEAAALRRV